MKRASPEDILQVWVAVSDNKTCPDCAKLNGRKARESYWEKTGQPGDGRTLCMDGCRCMLMPAEMSVGAIEKWIRKTLTDLEDDFAHRLSIDTKTGGYMKPIELKEYERNKDWMMRHTYQKIGTLNGYLEAWKIVFDNAPLPDVYWKIHDVDEQIAWLKRDIKKGMGQTCMKVLK